eukprot:1440961-Pyramimonas_sp.AAC.1
MTVRWRSPPTLAGWPSRRFGVSLQLWALDCAFPRPKLRLAARASTRTSLAPDSSCTPSSR